MAEIYKDYIKTLETMLYAVCNEVVEYEDEYLKHAELEDAEENENCPGIRDWYLKNATQRIERLKKEGLPKNPSVNEERLWDMIQEVREEEAENG